MSVKAREFPLGNKGAQITHLLEPLVSPVSGWCLVFCLVAVTLLMLRARRQRPASPQISEAEEEDDDVVTRCSCRWCCCCCERGLGMPDCEANQPVPSAPLMEEELVEVKVEKQPNQYGARVQADTKARQYTPPCGFMKAFTLMNSNWRSDSKPSLTDSQEDIVNLGKSSERAFYSNIIDKNRMPDVNRSMSDPSFRTKPTKSSKRQGDIKDDLYLHINYNYKDVSTQYHYKWAHPKYSPKYHIGEIHFLMRMRHCDQGERLPTNIFVPINVEGMYKRPTFLDDAFVPVRYCAFEMPSEEFPPPELPHTQDDIYV